MFFIIFFFFFFFQAEDGIRDTSVTGVQTCALPILARTSVLEQVGCFDERFFMYAEDVDLSRRIREGGWQLYYLSDAAVTHVAGGTTKKAGSDFSILMACESMAKLISKYQGRVAGMLYQAAVFGG